MSKVLLIDSCSECPHIMTKPSQSKSGELDVFCEYYLDQRNYLYTLDDMDSIIECDTQFDVSKKMYKHCPLNEYEEKLDFIALWAHDQFPYILGGRIIEVFENGSVKVERFGNYRFKPLTIVPLNIGRKILKQIKEVSNEYNSTKNELYNKAIKDLMAIDNEALSKHFQTKNKHGESNE